MLLAQELMAEEEVRTRGLRDKLYAGFSDMEEVVVNGDLEQRIGSNLNISFNYVEGESLLMAISMILLYHLGQRVPRQALNLLMF